MTDSLQAEDAVQTVHLVRVGQDAAVFSRCVSCILSARQSVSI